jgi:hypothetical protein
MTIGRAAMKWLREHTHGKVRDRVTRTRLKPDSDDKKPQAATAGVVDGYAHGPVGLPEPRANELFKQHPLTPFVLKSGKVVSTPFHAYRVDSLNVYGTVDYAKAKEYLKGTGLQPVMVGDKAVVCLWIENYEDTMLGKKAGSGKYPEMAFTLAVTPETPDGKPVQVPSVNEFSTLASAGFTQFLSPLLIGRSSESHEDRESQETTIAWGKEVAGYEKQAGDVTIERHGFEKTFTVKDASGNLVLSGKVRDDPSPKNFAAGVGGMMQALGPQAVGQLLAAGGKGAMDIVNRDVSDPQRMRKSHGDFVNQPMLMIASSQAPLTLGSSSQLGGLLSDWGYQAQLFADAPNAAFVLEAENNSPEARQDAPGLPAQNGGRDEQHNWI